jgi:predicted AAA+ superfamily ATPase
MIDLIYDANTRLLKATKLDFSRLNVIDINWENRLIAIIGARGVGKTTLMLQYIKKSNVKSTEMLYVSAEHIYFSIKTLTEFVDEFTKLGGKMLFIDEIHQYENWAREVKVIYDSYPDLKMVISGSSILDLKMGTTDLSRRLVTYELPGLSFREYLMLSEKINLPVLSISDVLTHNEVDLKTPLVYFKQYLKSGYYPFFKEPDYLNKLHNVINKIIDTDLVKHIGLNVDTGTKIKRLLGHIAANVPFKPNVTKLGEITGISLRLLPEYLRYMERGGLLHLLYVNGKSITALAKPDKIYLNNTNLSFALTENPDLGNIRETFFISMLAYKSMVSLPPQGDFFIDGRTFEVGGKSKKQKQLKGVEKGFVVKDDIETGYGNIIPLWKFGLLY